MALKATLTIHLAQSSMLSTVEITTSSLIEGGIQQTSRATISPDQLFVRVEEVVANRLRAVCNEMEGQIRKQRKQTT